MWINKLINQSFGFFLLFFYYYFFYVFGIGMFFPFSIVSGDRCVIAKRGSESIIKHKFQRFKWFD